MTNMEKKLQRIPHQGAVAGVCAGLGEYFRIDKTWVRVFFILSVFFAGYGIGLFGPIVYVVLWIVLPVKAVSLPNDPFNVDYRVDEFPPYESSGAFTAPIPKTKGREPKDRYVAGIMLLAIGSFFLMHQLDIIYWRDFTRFWPVLIMLFGVGLLISSFNTNKQYPPQPPTSSSSAEENNRDEENGTKSNSYE